MALEQNLSEHEMASGLDQLEGALISAHDGIVRGWALDRLSPDRAVEVEVFAGGMLLGFAQANARDPAQPGGIEGAHAFKLLVSGKISMLTTPYAIRARVRGAGVELHGVIEVNTEAEHRRTLVAYDGEVAGVAGGAFEGWAVQRAERGEPVTIEIFCRGERLGAARADRPEPIAAAWGGGYGFRIPLPPAILDGAVHVVSFRVAGSDFELTGSPMPVSVMATQTLVARLDRFERELTAGLEWVRNAETRLAELYDMLGSDLSRRFDALLLLQRNAVERELSVLRGRLGVEGEQSQLEVKTQASVRVVMDEKVVGFGWHGAEDDRGIKFRWMAVNAVVVVDFTATRSARLILLIRHILDESHTQTLRVTVNGEPVSAPSWKQEGDLRRYEAVVPASAFRGRSFAVINLIADFARKPSSGDYRDLSIALSEVRLDAREAGN
jgi:hypothetical protein